MHWKLFNLSLLDECIWIVITAMGYSWNNIMVLLGRLLREYHKYKGPAMVCNRTCGIFIKHGEPEMDVGGFRLQTVRNGRNHGCCHT